MPDDAVALLLVAVDPVDAELWRDPAASAPDALTQSLLPAGSTWMLETSPPPIDDAAIRVPAGPNGEVLAIKVWSSGTQIVTVRGDDGLAAPESDESLDLAELPEPMLPLGIEELPPAVTPQPPAEAPWVEPMAPASEEGSLSSLFDRLAGDAGLYSPLTEADETFAGALTPVATPESATPSSPPGGLGEEDLIAAMIEYADDPEASETADDTTPKTHWMITGRGFRRLPPEPAAEGGDADGPPAPSQPSVEDAPPVTPATAPVALVTDGPDRDAAERVSRYNFAELGRILTDRVGGDGNAEAAAASTTDDERPDVARLSGGVVSLSAETLVLNRLPLAILVFRDQQVLFANRALMDLLGHESVESLRSAGLGSIFPTPDSAVAGPINRLVRRDGTPFPVTARLQSVSWQGRSALMLSANASEPVRGHEGAVRAFAEIAAEAREEGFIAADRAGLVTQLSGHGAVLLGRPADELISRPIAVLVGANDMDGLRAFLEKPARFAETARPSLLTASEDGNADIALFAEGQAGVVSGYFGFIKKRAAAPVPAAVEDELDPSLLGRLSRGIRRPLNTIIGFADLIRSAGIGVADQQKFVEYARDIRTAGLEIAVLVDELEDFTRLRDGRYTPRPAEVDLGALLDSCIVRVRAQAGAARVLVRSAIAERLPRIRADRASLGQAVLNLLASAIDQTPIGSSVILSAQSGDDGSVAIHIRDSGQNATDLAERFVVFRDGQNQDGEDLQPVRSSVGLALTRSLLAVNACSLSIDPTAGVGTLLTLTVPAENVARA
ncbi:MAG: ATP-binding protein [Devosia sp.]